MVTKSKKISLVDFPEEVDEKNGVRLYGETSYENHMAVLSHFLHNHRDEIEEEEKAEIIAAIREFLSRKEARQPLDIDEMTDEQVWMAAEDPAQYGLFSDFFDVPFPAPENPKFTFIDLFAGIGGIRIPFDEMGYQCVFSSEWDAKACKTYFANFGTLPFGDITKIPAERIPKHDVLLAGFPCQAFSIMGKMQGFADTRGTMFFEIERILKHHHTPCILLENVKQLVGHDEGRTFKVILERLDQLGYYVKWQVLNALDFGLPQKRERVIIVGFLNKDDYNAFSFDIPHTPYNLADILESDEVVDPTLFASDHIIAKRREKTSEKQVFYPSIWHENKAGNISVLDYSCALRTGASYNYLLVNGVRRPSSRELLRLQGFPEKFKIAVSHQDIRRQTGNSVAVPMIRMVAQKINEIISNKKEYGTPEIKRFKAVAYA
ncbi:MAG: DNA (cytosine-5-)-methyltransferase [Bacteroidales bacterium]|nr:DNA (cytosine-5-)-methyltransferase [Bacteroidales bacterium]